MGSSSDEVREDDDKERARFRSNMLLIKPNRSASKGCLIPFLYKVGRRLYILVGLSFKVYFHAVLLEKTHANLVLALWSPFAVVDAFYSSLGVWCWSYRSFATRIYDFTPELWYSYVARWRCFMTCFSPLCPFLFAVVEVLVVCWSFFICIRKGGWLRYCLGKDLVDVVVSFIHLS